MRPRRKPDPVGGLRGLNCMQVNTRHLGTSTGKAGVDEEREGGHLGGGIERSAVALVGHYIARHSNLEAVAGCIVKS